MRLTPAGPKDSASPSALLGDYHSPLGFLLGEANPLPALARMKGRA